MAPVQKIRIGCGAGFSGDRLEPALVLAEYGDLDYLILECLAERTIALAQKRKLQNPDQGYDPMLEKRMAGLLPLLVKNKITLISNMGAANPIAAAKKIKKLAEDQQLSIKIAAVTGDDVLEHLNKSERSLEDNLPINQYGEIISANAYLGTEGIVEALCEHAQIIITGRVADPSLFLAPMMHYFRWPSNDIRLLSHGTIVGHLLECAGQVTGGYFADPSKKQVADLAHLGHPYADIFQDGRSIISKVPGTGGVVNLRTVKEQLLYEVTDPYAYQTPDVIADFSTVRLQDLGNDQVEVYAGSGRSRPLDFKVSIGYKAYFKGEAEISYGGAGARERALQAAEIIQIRLKDQYKELRFDLMGINSLHLGHFEGVAEPYEIRLRIACKADTEAAAALLGEEVEALYTNGPFGGGGVTKKVTEIIGITSILMDRKLIRHHVTIV